MEFIDDLFLIIGLLFIIIPTFLLNVYVGCYVLGVFFLIFSILFAREEPPKQE